MLTQSPGPETGPEDHNSLDLCTLGTPHRSSTDGCKKAYETELIICLYIMAHQG